MSFIFIIDYVWVLIFYFFVFGTTMATANALSNWIISHIIPTSIIMIIKSVLYVAFILREEYQDWRISHFIAIPLDVARNALSLWMIISLISSALAPGKGIIETIFDFFGNSIASCMVYLVGSFPSVIVEDAPVVFEILSIICLGLLLLFARCVAS